MTGLTSDYLPPETRKLPVSWALAGQAIPPVCARHGAAPAREIKLKAASDPPFWVYLFILAGVIGFYLALALTTTNVKIRNWPVCSRCITLRHQRVLAGVGMLVLSLALCTAGTVFQGTILENVYPFVTIAIFIGAIPVFVTSEYARVSRIKITRDGHYLDVRKAAPAFQTAVEQAHIAAKTTGTWATPTG